MKLTFKYNKEKDIWCLLTKGKSSDNLDSYTEVYKALVAQYGDSPTEAETSVFIDEYIKERNISFDVYIERYEKEWEIIADEFYKRAESIFGVTLSHDITVYFTINNLCPYNAVENYFFIKTTKSPTAIIMHELWHFYTWYSFGADQQEKLGKQRYNAFKEALTILLDVECGDLFPEGVIDAGYRYTQHQDLRIKILTFWEHDKNIHNLWNYLIAQ